jgi:Ala-tRNA(Pro) deacylase
MTVDHTPEQGLHGFEAVTHFLDRQRAPYELIEHTNTFAALDEASAAGSAPAGMAKTVLLHDHGGFRAAVIPASECLDLHKARELLQASGHLRLASEEEIEREFPVFDAGALPPFSGLLGTPEILDTRLLAHDHVLCSGGDHRHTLKISPREIERLGEPLVADICQAHRSLSEKEKLLTHQPEGGQMPATKKPASRPRATPADRARAEDDARRLEHIAKSLEAAQKDLGAIGGSLGTGVRELRRDVNRMLRDARRDLLKMRRAIQRDLDQLQKDLTSAATAKPAAPRRTRTAPAARTAKRQTAASSR